MTRSTMTVPALLLALLAPAAIVAQSRTLDSFDDVAPWTTVLSDGVSGKIAPDRGALRFDVDFHGGAGYAVIRRALPLVLPSDYTISFRMRGTLPPNNIEFKLVDASGENVWWVNRRDVVFSRDWKTVTIRKRHVSFAWGPLGGGEPRNLAALEIAVTAGKGGKGSVWFDSLTLAPRDPSAPLPAASSTLATDFGGMRELGGITVRWARGVTPPDYDVQLLGEDGSWTTAYRVRDANGGDDPIPLPDADARGVRLVAAGDDVIAPNALREVVFHPLAWSETPDVFAMNVAAGAPRGTYPRYLAREQSYWTILGTSGDRSRPLLSADGALEPFSGGFSVEPFIYDQRTLLGWADAPAAQSLLDGDLPIPTAHRQFPRVSLDVTAFVDGAPGRAVAWARYRVTNRSGAAATPILFLALRPFQVNPPWQFLTVTGGVAPIDSIRVARTGALIDGTKRIVAVTPALGAGASTFDAGDVTDWLRRGVLPQPTTARDAGGRASGALGFPMALSAGERRDVWIAIPLDSGSPTPSVSAQSESSASRGSPSQGEAALARTAKRWRAELNRTRIELGGEEGREYADAIRTALAHILINRDGPAIRPGARSYARSWIRDGAMMSTALLQLGHAREVRDYIEWYAPYQFASGKIPCCVDTRGADPVPEHDSHGEFIHLVAQYARFSGDSALARRMWPRVAKAAAYIDSLRAQRLTPAYDTGSARMFRGILPPSISHEGYSAKPMHSFWDDFWALTGLGDAAELARTSGRREDAARLGARRDSLRASVVETIGLSMRAHGIDFIPGSADLGDFDATSTTVALAPGRERESLPQGALRNTFARYYAQLVARRDSAKGDDYTPYEWRNVGALVRLGEKRKALDVARFLFADRRPAAWNQWGEVVYRDPRTPKFIGDMPHTWVASDFIRSVLDLVAYERDDGALVIGAGVPELWANLEPGVQVTGLRTSYGPLDVSMFGGGRRVKVHVGGRLRVPEAGIVVYSPYDSRVLTASVNGKPVETDGRSVTIHSLPADIAFGH